MSNLEVKLPNGLEKPYYVIVHTVGEEALATAKELNEQLRKLRYRGCTFQALSVVCVYFYTSTITWYFCTSGKLNMLLAPLLKIFCDACATPVDHIHIGADLLHISLLCESKCVFTVYVYIVLSFTYVSAVYLYICRLHALVHT